MPDSPVGQSSAPRTATGLRGLLVEDDPAGAELVKLLVEDGPGPRLDLQVAETMAEAKRHLAEGGWDVVLLDLSLPDAQGMDTIAQVVAAGPDVPIVVLTGDDDEAVAVSSVREGAQDYLVKGSFDGDLLLRAVRYAIERRRSEVALRRSEARLAAVFEHLPEGVLLLDGEGRLLLINPTARSYLPIMLERTIQVGERLLHLGGFPLAELLDISAEGGWHEVIEDSTIPQVFEVRAGRLSRRPAGNLLLVIRDVTHARELQRQVGMQQRLAAVGELSAGIAHDFNNVLQVMIGAAELLADSDDLTDRARERASFISNRGQHAARVIQQILTFSSSSLLERRRFDLGEFVGEVTSVLAKGIPEDIALQVRCVDGPLPVHADPSQLQQILTNLAINARDAMPTGGAITVSLDRLDLDEESAPPSPGMPAGPWAVLEVSDTGQGIPAEVMPRVFEPFYTTKEIGYGTGLGLSQVYGSVSQHGGFIDVRSPAGKGAHFVIHLPLESEPAAGELAQSAGAAQGEDQGEDQGEGAKAPRRTVLVVEDEDDVRHLVADILAHLGYDPITAKDGVEGLQVYRENRDRVGLVLTDKTMPEMGGLELARALNSEFPGVKVLILTGYLIADREAEVGGNPAVFGWVPKPIEIEHLARVVEAAFKAA